MPVPRSSGTLPVPYRRLPAAVAVSAVLCLVIAACGSAKSAVKKIDRSTTPGTSVQTGPYVHLNGRWPLTGAKLTGTLPNRPVYVVKIDNSEASAPQVGLKAADMVVEELVEGGITRLAVFFYQRLPPVAGPVRSMRASDIGIVSPVHSVLIASGGAPRTVARIRRAHIRALTESSGGFYRDLGRTPPYNLFMRTSRLHPGHWRYPSHTYLPFGNASAFKGRTKVRSMSVTFSGSHTTSWAYTPRGWRRPGSYAQAGDDYRADNVLILTVRVGNAGYLDPAGNPVPESIFVGSGPGTLVHGSHRVNVRWHKKKYGSKLALTGPAGHPVTVPSGHTWIELIPRTTGRVLFRR
jgi:Protein of unknown function (DUF3048) N-terminal domain/Protein of unknown function (DUF3048) C-terminal domain